MLRTTAWARIMPPGTSKTRVRSVPTRWVMEPQRKRPPMLSVWTRETCCWPPPYQVTDMPLGREMRWYRRVFGGGFFGVGGFGFSLWVGGGQIRGGTPPFFARGGREHGGGGVFERGGGGGRRGKRRAKR